MMKTWATIFIFLFFFFAAQAQKVQTVVPKQVVAGNAFQIQYIVSEPSSLANVGQPEFDNLRLVSGPNHYKGNSLINGKMQPIENISFTVVPLKEGSVKIKGITFNFKNSDDERTDDIVVTVLPQPKASFNAQSTYTDLRLYAPSSKADLDKLIEENLFIKAEVDKRVCFLGEAITATFKLYSSLQSTSEVINAPSLYGFSVMDVLNVHEVHQAVETINGKIFNTSVLRKLQLYPSQTGKLMVDQMQLQNEVEFDDSATGKKIKVEKLLASQPIEIVVKALPGKQPADFSEAIGKFDIRAKFQQAKIEAGQQGKLIVTLSGRGNFIQLNPPIVEWPKGFEVFEPLSTEDINKNVVPAEGVREYVFMFTTDQTGSYKVPPVSFSFFDPQSRTYKKSSSDSLQLEVIPASRKEIIDAASGRTNNSNTWIWFCVAAILLIALLAFLFIKKKPKPIQPVQDTVRGYAQKFQDIVSSQSTDKQLCTDLQKLLSEIHRTCNLSSEQSVELKSIKYNCELLVYSDIAIEGQKEELIKRTEKFVNKLNC
jgi:hypothetical protein